MYNAIYIHSGANSISFGANANPPSPHTHFSFGVNAVYISSGANTTSTVAHAIC